MTEDTPIAKATIIDILKDPATYRKAWFGAAVPLLLGFIGAYTDDSVITLAEALSVVAASLGTGGTIFFAKNKPVAEDPNNR